MKFSQTNYAVSFVKLLLLFMMLLPLPGCGVLILGGAAAGTVGYVSGDLNATLEGGFDDVIKATDRAIEENTIIEISKEASSHRAAYVLKTPQDDKIELTITRATRELTSVTIRVGVFGDEPLSHQVLKEIETRLK